MSIRYLLHWPRQFSHHDIQENNLEIAFSELTYYCDNIKLVQTILNEKENKVFKIACLNAYKIWNVNSVFLFIITLYTYFNLPWLAFLYNSKT